MRPRSFNRLARCALPGLMLACAVAVARAAPAGFIEPTKKDRCPVCGMFVSRYPDWLAQIVFRDGSYAVFDGAKDMFRCYFDMKSFAPGKSRDAVQAIFVTDYYTLELIDAERAWYVVGGDVYGPMGKELIPFRERADAKGFLKDHRAERVIAFTQARDALPWLLE